MPRKSKPRNENGFRAAKQTEATQSHHLNKEIVMNNTITTANENHALVNIHHQNIGGDAVQAVNARELHAFLEIGRDFSTWIKSRISQYDFVENADYITLTQMGEHDITGKIEYLISLDMAKELSMVERNEKGKQARRYFIECERRANDPLSIPQSLPDALRLAADLAEEKARVEHERDEAIRTKAYIADALYKLTNKDSLGYADRTITCSGSPHPSVFCGFFMPEIRQAHFKGGSREPNTTPSGNKFRRLQAVVEARHPTNVATNETKLVGVSHD